MPKLFNQKPDDIPVQDAKWQAGDGLGTKIEKVFIRFIQRVILWGWEFFGEIMVGVFDASMKILQPGMERMMKPLVDEVKRTQGIPDWMKNLIVSIEAEKGESKIMGQLALFASMFIGVIAGGFTPMGKVFAYGIDKNLRSARPSINEATELWRRGFLDDTTYNIIKEDTGVPNEVATALNGMLSSDVNPNDLIFGFWRGFYDEAEFRSRLLRAGASPGYLDLWLEKTKVIPPITDLIRFMVREAFNDETSARFGYDDDYPTAINPFLPKVGLSADWGKRFWRSHWVLPSPSQAYEMLHRGLITADDLKELLKTSDYPSFWRDNLMKISYNVYTRVDVRRMLQAHVLTEDEAFQAYKDMGYPDDKARKLTDFALAGITQEERDLTKGEILDLYEENLTDRNGTASNLVKMGYDTQEAEEMLKLADVNIAKAARTDIINYVKERYQARVIDRAAAQNELVQAGLKQQSVDRYLLAFDRVIENDVAVPSKADVRKWYLADYIDETRYRDYLKLLKYKQEDIDLYVRDANDQKAKVQSEQTA